MEETQWFYVEAGQQRGPVGAAGMGQFITAGQVTRDTLVWRAGLAQWQPAGSVPELFSSPDSAPQTAPIPGFSSSAPAIAPLAYGGYPPSDPALDQSSKATTAFVLSIVGIVIPCAGSILGIIAIVLASTSLSGMKTHNSHKGHGLAIAALVIGILDVVGWIPIVMIRMLHI